MKKADEGYITPEEVKARGIIRRKDGTFYLLNTLEKYADKGWLNFGDKRFDKDFRLDAAQMFHRDFMESRISDMAAVDLSKDRVDGGNHKELPEYVWDARRRYFSAREAINRRYRGIIVRVVLDDKPLRIVKLSSGQYNHDLELAKEYLCLGLDELIYHYGLKPRRRRPITGYAVSDFWENFYEYCQDIS